MIVGRLRLLFARLALAYAAFIAVWLLLRVLWFDRFWPLAILNTGAFYLLLPLPLFALTALWSRHQWALAALLLPLAAWLYFFGVLCLTPTSAHIGPAVGSDHRPVWANLILAP